MQKVKVLTYANDCNTVCNKYMEIHPVSYHAEIFTTSPDQYDKVDLIFKFKNIYYCEGSYTSNQINTGEIIVIPHFQNYLNTRREAKYIQNIFIVLFETLGMDASELIKLRAEIAEKRETEKQVKIVEKAAYAEQCRIERLNQLNAAKLNFISGKEIELNDFLELIKINNIPLHIRSIGMLNKLQNCQIGINKAHLFGRNAKNINLDKVFDAAKLLAAC